MLVVLVLVVLVALLLVFRAVTLPRPTPHPPTSYPLIPIGTKYPNNHPKHFGGDPTDCRLRQTTSRPQPFQEVTQLIVDGERLPLSSGCENGTSLHVEREVEIVFSGGAVSSDDTWLVFVSHPAEFLCSSWFAMERGDPPTPGAVGAWQRMPRFRLEAAGPLSEEVGVVRAAMVNTCSSGTSIRYVCPRSEQHTVKQRAWRYLD